MVKKRYTFFVVKIFIFMLYFFTICGCSKSINSNVKEYKILQKKIKLLPLNTLSVLGLNTYLIKNDTNTYLITISAKVTKYNWLIDTIKVKKSLISDLETSSDLPDIPTNLYLTNDIDFLVNVKKINNIEFDYHNEVNVSSKIIELPYFIAVNDKINNNIYYMDIKHININLDSNKPIKFTRKLKIKFNEKYIDNLEILIGFKQTPKSFTNLKNYIINLDSNK